MAETFTGFETWAELLNYVQTGQPVYYHAPMDHRPVRVQVTVSGRRRGLRVYPPTRDADPFTADSGHLPRFKRQAEQGRS